MANASNAATYQCPNCNGVLEYNAATGKLQCDFCGGVFEEGQVQQAIPLGGTPIEAQAAQHVKTVDEFLDNAPWMVDQEGTAAALTTVRYSCPSCGAGIVADQSTVSTSCPYCGNNMFVAGIATADNIPDWVLPFSITREQAEAQMRQHFEHKWYLSRKFSASLEHMQAVYVPYHLYDISVSGWADYIAYDRVDSGENTSYYYYAFKRAGHASFRRIPVDGSSKMPDAHMDAIAPFDFAALRPFSPEYAAGYLMEVPDETPEQCLSRAAQRARTSFEEDMKNDVKNEPKIDGIDTVVADDTQVELDGAESCVLPVWLMHCTWNDNQMLFAVNGETGKCIGDLPISGMRRGSTVGITAVVFALLAFLVGFVMNGLDNELGSRVFAALVVATIAVPLFLDRYFKAQMRTAVEAKDAGMSYDAQGLVVTMRWRSEKHYGNKKKALKVLEEKNAGLIEQDG